MADFSRAFEAGDVAAIVAILTDDAWLTMPPVPLEYHGLDAIGHFLTTVALRDGRRFVLIPTRANGQPADPGAPTCENVADLVLVVLHVSDSRQRPARDRGGDCPPR
ncbi:nuclear transport factor 2 family protein [Nonomuraea sp. NPDC052265]|uniref:nuclear transport factor 2 family protein n=1 Tax=Nonomuraea sp. NPDC052265 TaxID=3364374 RepID=UPI0037C8FC84